MHAQTETPRRPSEHRLGLLLIILSALLYSVAGLFTKSVAAGAWDVLFWRGCFAAGFVTLWILLRGSARHEFGALGGAGWAIGVVGALGASMFIPAFKHTSIANVALIYAAAPLIAAALAWLAIRERIAPRAALGCVIAILGVGVIVSGSIGGRSPLENGLVGDALALGMTVVMAVMMVLYRVYPATPGAGPQVLQSLIILPFAWLLGTPQEVASHEIAMMAAFGFSFAAASVALAEGAKRVPSGQTALTSALETPLAPILAFFVLAEAPTTAALIGGAIVFGAVLLAIERHPDP